MCEIIEMPELATPPNPGEPHDITRLLGEASAGNSQAASRLMEAIYPDLKRIAARYLRTERKGHTLQATALVNEAYMQLLSGAGEAANWHNRSHFFAMMGQVIRRILVDYARMRNAKKRDGARHKVELTDGLAISNDSLDDVIAVDEALARLAAWDPRQCRVVEMRFFAGLTEEEIAGVLGVSVRTVKRDWNLARAWLHGELNSGAPH